jgi:hypothetical protein
MDVIVGADLVRVLARADARGLAGVRWRLWMVIPRKWVGDEVACRMLGKSQSAGKYWQSIGVF